MPLAARILFGAFGLVVAVYAAASLSGNWLSTPPWWERTERVDVVRPGVYGDLVVRRGASGEVVFETISGGFGGSGRALWITDSHAPRPGRELISVGVGAVGLAALAFAAWPRRKPGSA